METVALREGARASTELGCPECIGVLHLQAEPDGQPRYVCRVGHEFEPVMLLQGKEAVLEKMLWSAVVLLEEIADAYEATLPELAAPLRAETERRSAKAREQAKAVRRIIEDTRLPAADLP
jgi:two-component system chemotaxis response regulator CheB